MTTCLGENNHYYPLPTVGQLPALIWRCVFLDAVTVPPAILQATFC